MCSGGIQSFRTRAVSYSFVLNHAKVDLYSHSHSSTFSQTSILRVICSTGTRPCGVKCKNLACSLPTYSTDKATSNYIRKLMAFPFLPHKTIEATFHALAAEATAAPLQQLVKYVQVNWVESRIWPPKTWSVFMQAVRTNNNQQPTTELQADADCHSCQSTSFTGKPA